MKKHNLCSAAIAATMVLGGHAIAQTSTLKKVKESGVITMGVRDASGAMSFTLGQANTQDFTLKSASA